MKVPFVDLKRQYRKLESEISPYLKRIFSDTSFINGAALKKFEEEFARFLNVNHVVACSSGTSALYLILRALHVEPGDEVLLPVNTFIATAEAISLTGAKPVFVDVAADTSLIDCDDAEKKISSRTKAIIPVHLYGQMANMDKILVLAKKHRLKVVEDACQAHDAKYKGKMAGTFGIASAFSFYPSKNLGTCADGGAVATNDKNLEREIRMLLDHGSIEKYHHERIGFNFRLSTIAAAILLVKLKYLRQYSEGRRKIANLYSVYLACNPRIVLPKEIAGNYHTYHLFVIKVNERDKLQKFLAEKHIGAGIHYPIPLHLQGACRELGNKEGDYPAAEKLAKQILSLPMFPELTEAEVKYVCKNVNSFYGIK